MSFKPYVVKARIANMDIFVGEVQRRISWRLQRHATPGNLGDSTHHSGRASYEDSVTALLTQPEAKQLAKLGDEKGFHLWQHPLLDPILGRIESLELPATPSLDGYFWATFVIVEHREPGQELFLYPASPQSAKAAATSAKGAFDGDLDGLGDLPDTKAGETFTGAVEGFDDAWDALDTALEETEDGSSMFRDVSRALDGLASAADAVVDAAADIADDIEGAGDAIIRSALAVVESARDAVDALEAVAATTVTFVVQSPSSLYGMMMDAGMAVTDAALESVMDASGIVDPLAVLPGTVVTLPVSRSS